MHLLGKVVEVYNALQELGVLIHHFEDVPCVLHFHLEALGLHVVRLALFQELRLVVVFQADCVALIRQVSFIRVLILAKDQLARVLEVFNVLVAHLGSVQDGGDGVDGSVEPAVPDVLQVDDSLQVLTDIHRVILFRVELRAQALDLVHEALGEVGVPLGLGVILVVRGELLNPLHLLEKDLSVVQLFPASSMT